MPQLKPAADRRGWLSRGVASVGLASFFSDSGHEIATAILPSFVTAGVLAAVAIMVAAREAPARPAMGSHVAFVSTRAAWMALAAAATLALRPPTAAELEAG